MLPLLFYLPLGLRSFRSTSKILEILVQPICEHYFTSSWIVNSSISPSQLFNSFRINLKSAISAINESLTLLHAIHLSINTIFFQFSLLPLLVGDACHYLFIRSCLLFTFLVLSTLLILQTLFEMLITLVYKTLLQPFLENLVSLLLLHLFVQIILLLFLIAQDLFVFIL